MVRQTLSLPFSGDRQRTARERAGLSIGGLSARTAALGHPVHRSYLGRLERDEYKPSPPVLKVIADALGVDVDELLDRTAEVAP